MDAAGWHGSDVLRRFRWLTGREWMQEHRAPYLPAWDVRTCELIEETGVLSPSPYVSQMAGPVQGGATWDMLYSLVRADLMAARNVAYEEAGVFYRVTREMILERTRAMHTRPLDAAARRSSQSVPGAPGGRLARSRATRRKFARRPVLQCHTFGRSAGRDILGRVRPALAV